jgi:hypothetical protein
LVDRKERRIMGGMVMGKKEKHLPWWTSNVAKNREMGHQRESELRVDRWGEVGHYEGLILVTLRGTAVD